MKHLDLFSGIGGFALAADWAFGDNEHIFCEIDEFCQQILRKHWPNAKIYGDIKGLEGGQIGNVDLLTGGFPCQPFSNAGKQRAQDDDRFLWPEMLRIIQECRPRWIVAENVVGIIELALEEVCASLEAEGYEVWPVIIPACAANAPHRRDRVWIIAHGDGKRGNNGLHCGEGGQVCEEQVGGGVPQDKQKRPQFKFELGKADSSGHATDTDSIGHEGRKKNAKRRQRVECEKQFERFYNNNDWGNLPKPGLSRGDDGFSERLDRTKALGNAIVPQVAYEIMLAISEIENEPTN